MEGGSMDAQQPHDVGRKAFNQDQDGRGHSIRSEITSNMELSKEETASWMWLSGFKKSKARPEKGHFHLNPEVWKTLQDFFYLLHRNISQYKGRGRLGDGQGGRVRGCFTDS